MLSSGQIMQYFKNSICIKGGGATLRNLTHKFAISAKPSTQKLLVQITRATKSNPHWSILQIILSSPHKFAYDE